MTNQIQENMPVYALGSGLEEAAAHEARIGTVDHLDGDRWIKLARKDAPDQVHHWIPVDWVSEVRDGGVHLALGVEAVKRAWKSEAPGDLAQPQL